ncbi:ATPase [Sedimentimonas flavescens]|uniref:ATPase n=1 Tax=Sedimentimonas flavescens TaxID=2851012 RepID=A0ABT3A141_9RHOB|nr:ATP12 family protein [Sedimentimonas flavescens]MCT2540339.1 ATPase [Sedimentimonas flavescens]MCV2879658.1 ATPase [Sedimentimonas flavescens]
MSGWTAKRFWKAATVTEQPGGFGVSLDGRALKTPAKALLEVPTRAMAEAIAAEWDAQDEKIDPTTMPVTRSANAAIDKVRHQHAEVAELIAAYGGTDLLCYRAEQPDELVARQAEAWDALLDWAEAELGARLVVTKGVIPVAQPAPALSALAARVAALDEYEMASVHDLVGITGSLVLGLAVAMGRLDAATAWDLARIDETWQIEQWGEDEEAAEQAALKREALLEAERFWALRHL